MWFSLLKRLLLALLFFTGYRTFMYAFNHDYFGSLNLKEIVEIWVGGLRFDLSSVLYVNALTIVLHIIPFKFRYKAFYQKILMIVFLLTNGLAMVVEWGDVSYFPYNFRRLIVADLAMKSDAGHLFTSFLTVYWYVFALYGIMLYTMYRLFKLTIPSKQIDNTSQKFYYLKHGVLMLLYATLTVIGMRGGLQMIPLMPINAADYVNNKKLMPLVSNTTLNLIMATEQKSMMKATFFSKDELEKRYNIYHEPDTSKPFRNLNVIVLVLESTGNEMIGYYNHGQGYTPFLDSLIPHCISFKKGYAAGTRSVQGISAIFSSMPYLMPDPFVWSAYQSNCLPGMAAYLKIQGYKTAFFHGGHNGTMNFDRYASSTGYDAYYGMNEYIKEYPDRQDFDGGWGIWDRKFYGFVIDKINQSYSGDKPFFISSFSMNPHGPFPTEPAMESQLSGAPVGRSKAQLYADLSLKSFFESAKTQPWFSNTLFVLVADHTGQPAEKPEYRTYDKRYQIPILFYLPSDSTFHGEKETLAQQIDIMPTVLEYLHYPTQISSFGQSLKLESKETQTNYHVTLTGEFYQINDGDFLLHFDGKQTRAMFHLSDDPECKTDVQIQFKDDKNRLENHLKAVLQTHYEALTGNRLCR